MAVKFRDYYEVLGVPRNAKPEEIKRAYRRLARKHHPDVQPAAERAHATERFKEINEANEVLSDPEKRSKYDSLGEHWREGMDFTPPPGAGAPPGARGQWRTVEGVDWQDLEGFSDFFASMFGGDGQRVGRGGRGEARRGVRMTLAGSDIEAVLPVTLEELLKGDRRRIQLDGKNLDVQIPRGARDGTTLRLAGQGGPGMNGGPPGDLYITLRLVPDPRYQVKGDDVEMDLPLWPWQAALGAEVRLETPEGAVKLKVPPGTQSEKHLRLRERGLPRADSSRGDLHAVVRIVNPPAPNGAEREAFEALKRASTAPPDRPARE